ncbi:hypothetical protein LCGC14_0378500 [marine sediment metagenome]|uniref:C2H2-type domain-containing protein n=1 Tax=marine sediment metagenome TaxID=412755 RepID=A0A0F9TL27_9ZZZZ
MSQQHSHNDGETHHTHHLSDHTTNPLAMHNLPAAEGEGAVCSCRCHIEGRVDDLGEVQGHKSVNCPCLWPAPDTAPRIISGPGHNQHCCRCGSHQKEFDLIQHRAMCENIRREQGWDQCRFCTPTDIYLAPGHITRTDCPAGCNWTFITKSGMATHLKNKHPGWELSDDRTRINSPVAGGYDAGRHSRDAEVVALQEQLAAAITEIKLAVGDKRAIQDELEGERDAARERERALVEAGKVLRDEAATEYRLVDAVKAWDEAKDTAIAASKEK